MNQLYRETVFERNTEIITQNIPREGISVLDLADKVGVSIITIWKYLRPQINKGVIRQIVCETDRRRARYIRVTDPIPEGFITCQ